MICKCGKTFIQALEIILQPWKTIFQGCKIFIQCDEMTARWAKRCSVEALPRSICLETCDSGQEAGHYTALRADFAEISQQGYTPWQIIGASHILKAE